MSQSKLADAIGVTFQQIQKMKKVQTEYLIEAITSYWNQTKKRGY